MKVAVQASAVLSECLEKMNSYAMLGTGAAVLVTVEDRVGARAMVAVGGTFVGGE